MINNGVDLLYLVLFLVFLLLVVDFWDRYNSWSEWDRNRRLERRRLRYMFQDSYSEMTYRQQLRSLISPGLIASMHRLTRSFEKFNEVLGKGYDGNHR